MPRGLWVPWRSAESSGLRTDYKTLYLKTKRYSIEAAEFLAS